MEKTEKRVTAKKGKLDVRQHKRWMENDQKIREWLIYYGMKSFREVSRALRIDKNTVAKHIGKIPKSEFYEKDGRIYLKASLDFIEKSGKIPDELLKILQINNFPCAYRTNEQQIGKIYYLTYPSPISPFPTTHFSLTDNITTELTSVNPYFIKEILEKAIEHNLINPEQPILEQLTNEKISEIFDKLFGRLETLYLIYTININPLKEWLKTEKAKKHLEKILPKIKTPQKPQTLKELLEKLPKEGEQA